MYDILRVYTYIFALPAVYTVRLGYVYEYCMTRACVCMHVHIAVISRIILS